MGLPSEVQPAFDDRPIENHTFKSALEHRADVFGDDPYLIYGHDDRQVSYAELDAVSNAIGNTLAQIGVEKGDNVSVMFRNPLQTAFAIYGINKIGAVYSPINFDYKGDILTYQINDSAPSVLLVEDQYIERINMVADELNTVDHLVVYKTDDGGVPVDDHFECSTFSAAKDGNTGETEVTIDWSDPASIMYTSGTTGQPKGCVLPYRWIFGNYSLFRSATIDRGDTIHYSLPLYHVSATYNGLAPALIAGTSVVLWDQFSTSEFWERIERYEATTTTLISVMQSWLMSQPEEPDDHRNSLNKVQMAPLPENHVEMCERFGFDLLTGQYGQTECGNPVTGVISPDNADRQTPDEVRRGMNPDEAVRVAKALDVPVYEEAPGERFIGTSMPLIKATVLDENDEELPPGEVGEFAVRPQRPGVIMSEYYRAPDKTVKAWSNLWWHTGDAVFRDEDHNFYFVDRIGDVIRRRGENVSSMQIQNSINDHPAVTETAVFPVPADEGGEDDIAAIVQHVDGAAVTDADLYEHIEPKLPEFMHPQYIEVVADLPTTETNKVEKYKLRQQFIDGELNS
ncbi:AMP-binding protein [Halomarina salina]|uniref:AMP-binding protein n=1 Tax=Halomarina salina TaxID=1872699 RepID=A0ABD5RTR1_9EURY|nr:AMP-binding protein [Halomarina salina]